MYRLGVPEVIPQEDTLHRQPARARRLVWVKAAGVAPWDAWIRTGKGTLPQPLLLTLGPTFGVVEAVALGATRLAEGGLRRDCVSPADILTSPPHPRRCREQLDRCP
jgi:NADPH:quinone reductase-like Zn-dependent oxidoreductase